MTQVKLCVIGCGGHANYFVYPALTNNSAVYLSAVCARHLDKAEKCRRSHGADHCYDNYQQMIDTEKPDAVVIVGPPKLHYEAGIYALSHGCPIYTEKPLGENVQQANELVETAKKYHQFGQVGFMMRHSAVMKEVTDIVASGQPGEFEHGTIKYFTSGPYRSDEIYGLPGLDDAAFLWRYLLVQAVHPLNLASGFLAAVTGVRADIRFCGENILLDIRLTDERGKTINVQLHTLVAPGYGNLIFATELFFSKQAMIFTDEFHSLDYHLPGKSTECRTQHWRFSAFGKQLVKMGYQTQIDHFIKAVNAKQQSSSITSLEDGLVTMQILDKILKQFKQQIC